MVFANVMTRLADHAPGFDKKPFPNPAESSSVFSNTIFWFGFLIQAQWANDLAALSQSGMTLWSGSRAAFIEPRR